jgi:CBS-domain-containing membrane protein
MLVRDMMSREIVSVSPSDTVATARARLREHQLQHLLVVHEGQVAGVIAVRDLVGKADDVHVDEFMTREVGTIDADATLRRAASMMVRATTGCLPVIENGRLTGMITTSDLMRVLNADMTLS